MDYRWVVVIVIGLIPIVVSILFDWYNIEHVAQKFDMDFFTDAICEAAILDTTLSTNAEKVDWIKTMVKNECEDRKEVYDAGYITAYIDNFMSWHDGY